MADCGIASRRRNEELIAAGRVAVNGTVIRTPGVSVELGVDEVTVDGRAISKPSRHVYYMLNKPRGYLVTASDDRGRLTVMDLMSGVRERVVPVGRLDLDTEGLLLMTSDGELAHRLMHPRWHVEKEYHVIVEGFVRDSEVDELRSGVEVEGRRTQPAKVDLMRADARESELVMTIREGRKRQVRLMCAAVAHPVLSLKRVREGPLRMSRLGLGQWRRLTKSEVHVLRHAVNLE